MNHFYRQSNSGKTYDQNNEDGLIQIIARLLVVIQSGNPENITFDPMRIQVDEFSYAPFG